MELTEGEVALAIAFLWLIEEHYGGLAVECEEKCRSECSDTQEEECTSDRETACECDKLIRDHRKMELWARVLRENIEQRMAIEPDEIGQFLSECLYQIKRSEALEESSRHEFDRTKDYHDLVVDSGQILIRKCHRRL